MAFGDEEHDQGPLVGTTNISANQNYIHGNNAPKVNTTFYRLILCEIDAIMKAYQQSMHGYIQHHDINDVYEF